MSPRPTGRTWNTISFASTLYLCPILDLLVAEIPDHFQLEVRLGLQEALVNAAKHGNNLDPSKTVVVRFSTIADHYWWVISDEGAGFIPECCCLVDPDEHLPEDESECGRGLYILHKVFDRVHWNADGTELSLCKQVKRRMRLPMFMASNNNSYPSPQPG
jgi:serine/threonine-protein kinase RsbW